MSAQKKKGNQDRVAAAAPIELAGWLKHVEAQATAHHEKADEPRGACLVKDPQTGQTFCIRTTKNACKSLKGTYIGGPCGG